MQLLPGIRYVQALALFLQRLQTCYTNQMTTVIKKIDIFH